LTIALGLCSCAVGEIRPDDDDDYGADTDTDTDTDTDSDTGTDTDTDIDTDTGSGDVCPYHCVSTTTMCNGMSGVVHDEYACDFPTGGVCCDF
jgi:hypothetical protein